MIGLLKRYAVTSQKHVMMSKNETVKNYFYFINIFYLAELR